jgi:hypothetical protein
MKAVDGKLKEAMAEFGNKPTASVVMKDTDGLAPGINVADARLNGDSANRGGVLCCGAEFCE